MTSTEDDNKMDHYLRRFIVPIVIGTPGNSGSFVFPHEVFIAKETCQQSQVQKHRGYLQWKTDS